MAEQMRILVTGGAGFIGSTLVDKLLEKKFEVVCLDDFNHYYNPKFKWQNIEAALKNKKFTLFKVDIRNFKKLAEVFEKVKIDKIIHLAARAGVRPSIKNPRLYEEVNNCGTLNLLELARIHKVPDFIFGSSSSVYGNSKKMPLREDDRVDTPISPYAATKRYGELMTYTYSHLYGLNCTVLRLFSVYGPRGRPDMAPYIFTKAILTGQTFKKFGNGDQARDWTYVDNIVAGIIEALDKNFDYEIINLGNSNPVTLNTLIATLEKICGRKATVLQLPEIPGEVKKTYANISKAKKLLNWQPKVELEVGLKKFVDWFVSAGRLAS